MLVKVEPNRMVQTTSTRNFELFDQKQTSNKKRNVFFTFFLFNHFWQRVDAILEDVSRLKPQNKTTNKTKQKKKKKKKRKQTKNQTKTKISKQNKTNKNNQTKQTNKTP